MLLRLFLVLFTVLFLGLISCHQNSPYGSNYENFSGVIYGEDSRKNIGPSMTDAKPSSQSAATALILRNDEIKKTPQTLLQTMPLLCKDEKFLTEPVQGFCSGVLIAPDKLLTAGHCFRGKKECEESSVIFGFTAAKAKGKINPYDVYRCKEIVVRENTIVKKDLWSLDYAVIQLDRPVKDVLPVKIASQADLPKVGDVVISLSHPLGLPLKQDIAKILPYKSEAHFLRVGVDTFSSSSGSPLFNQAGELVGILSEGADDLIAEELDEARRNPDGPCLRFQRCNESTPTPSCPGELFFKTWLVP